MSTLVLASHSAARARLLTEAGVVFDVEGPQVDEGSRKAEALARGLDPRAVALDLAEAKALEVSRRRAGLVIGADQTLDLDGRLFDKPQTLQVARTQLQALSGRAHRLHSAVALAETRAVRWHEVQTVTLHMRVVSDAFLDDYLAREGEALLGCVGAYRLEGLGAQLFERIEGDYFTVLGLPLLPLLAALRDEGRLAA